MSTHIYPNHEAARQARRAQAKDGRKADAPRSATMEAMGKLPTEARKVLSGTDASLIAAAFDQIRSDYGSLDAYFAQELDVTPEDRKQLQALYLEPAPLMTKSSAQL